MASFSSAFYTKQKQKQKPVRKDKIELKYKNTVAEFYSHGGFLWDTCL